MNTWTVYTLNEIVWYSSTSMLNWLCNLILGSTINQTVLLTTFYNHINMEVLIGVGDPVFTGWKY